MSSLLENHQQGDTHMNSNVPTAFHVSVIMDGTRTVHHMGLYYVIKDRDALNYYAAKRDKYNIEPFFYSKPGETKWTT